MGAWKNMDLDVTFDGVIAADGSIADNGDDPLSDMTYIYLPEL